MTTMGGFQLTAPGEPLTPVRREVAALSADDVLVRVASDSCTTASERAILCL